VPVITPAQNLLTIKKNNRMKHLINILFILSILSFANIQAQTRNTLVINDLKDAKSDNDGSQNGSSIFLGINAGKNDDQSNNRNIGIGYHSLMQNIKGNSNLAIGNYALHKNKSENNIALGDMSLSNNVTGKDNIAIGVQSGGFFEANNPYGNLSGCILIGSKARAYSQNDKNEIAIGYNVLGSGSNSITLGNEQNKKTILTGKVGIGTKNPKYSLDVYNQLRVFNSFDKPQLILDGNKGNEEVTFQKSGTYKAAIGYNTDEDYVYIYKSGNVKFKDGNIKASGDYYYDKPKTYTYAVAASDFNVYYNRAGAKVTFTDQGSVIVAKADSKAMVLIAPVHLPEGAKVTNLRIYSEVFNNSVLEIAFKSKNVLKRDSKILAKVSESGKLDVHEKKVSVSNVTISNQLHNYYIIARFVTPNLGSYVMLNGIAIDYQLEKISN